MKKREMYNELQGSYHLATIIMNIFDNFISPRFKALSGMILWAVTAELLFSTTAKRRNMSSSKWTRKRNCSFHMGFRVFRWMGFVRKWQLSRGMPRISTSIHGLPVLLLGHTFWPETIWREKKGSKSLKIQKKQRQPWHSLLPFSKKHSGIDEVND